MIVDFYFHCQTAMALRSILVYTYYSDTLEMGDFFCLVVFWSLGQMSLIMTRCPHETQNVNANHTFFDVQLCQAVFNIVLRADC